MYRVHIVVLVAYLTLDSHFLAAVTGLGQMLNSGQTNREPHGLFGEKELRPFEQLLLALPRFDRRGGGTRSHCY